MDDQEILGHIGKLVEDEHELYRRAEHEGMLTPDEQQRLHGLKVALDQCWDLLDQRKGLREFGRSPDEAKVRDASTVEKYLQ